MINLQEELKIKIVSPFWEEAYQRALLDSEQPEWLTADYIKYLNREIGIVAEHEEQVLDALERVVKDKKLNLLAKTLYHILSVCKVSEEAITEMEYPRNPPEDVDFVGYRFVLLFPMLAHVKTAYDAIVGKGIDETIAKKTFKAFDACIALSTVKTGYPCFSVMYFRWNFLYINQRMYRIGRFEFEIIPKINEPVRAFMSKKGQITTLMDNAKIHKSGHLLGAAGCMDEEGAYDADFLETEDYYEGYAVNADSHLVEKHRIKLFKTEWEPIFKSGDMLIGVHIPAEEKLDRATCVASYGSAREFFKKYFPQYDFKAFITKTWLLAPELPMLLKPESNILDFQKQFNIFPLPGKGRAVFNFVFNISLAPGEQVEYDKLKKDTSLRMSLIKHYRDGNYVHEFGGYIPF